MSAYMCEYEVFQVIAIVAAQHYSGRHCDQDLVNEYARELWQANRESIWARYGQQEDCWEDLMSNPPPKVSEARIAGIGRCWLPDVIERACSEYDYQACEFEGYRASKAKLIVDFAQSAAFRKALKRLPQHDLKVGSWGQ